MWCFVCTGFERAEKDKKRKTSTIQNRERERVLVLLKFWEERDLYVQRVGMMRERGRERFMRRVEVGREGFDRVGENDEWLVVTDRAGFW